MRQIGLVFLVCMLSSSAATAGETSADALTFREIHFSQLYDNAFNGPGAVVVSPDGNDVYVSGINGGTVAHFDRNSADGTLVYESATTIPESGFGGLVALAISPNGRFLFVIEASDDYGVTTLARDPQTGAIAVAARFFDSELDVPFVDPPFQLLVSPDARFLYVRRSSFSADQPGPAFTVMSIHPTTGVLTEIQEYYRRFDVPDGLRASGFVSMSPDGRNVYVPSPEWDLGVGILSRNASTGELSHLDWFADTGGGTRTASVAPDGRHVYFAGLSSFHAASRDAAGRLSLVQAFDAPTIGTLSGNPARVAVAPDGRRVYLVSVLDTHIAAFSRDRTTGLLSLIEEVADGPGGSFVLNAPVGPEISPSSDTVYVAGNAASSLVVLAVERPNLPCLDGDLIDSELALFQEDYALEPDLDRDGVPEFATLAMVSEASCSASISDSFDEAVTNAYFVNKATFGTEAEVFDSGVWTSYQHVVPSLLLTNSAMEMYLNNYFPVGQELQPYYVIVDCRFGECEPANARGMESPLPMEPFAGHADPDDDGVTNAQEWANVAARGGSEREFGVSALDPTNDGTREVSFESGGDSCFIATAAYGTPLAADLDRLRAFRDSRVLTNPLGSAFADSYYRLSPPAAKFVATRPFWRSATRYVLALPISYPRVFQVVAAIALVFVAVGAVPTLRVRRGSSSFHPR